MNVASMKIYVRTFVHRARINYHQRATARTESIFFSPSLREVTLPYCIVLSYRLKNGPHKNTVRELASEPQHTSKKNSKNTHIRLTTLPRSPWRRTTLCHHPLEDAREAHRRPRINPPRHSHRSAPRDIHCF